MLDQVPDGFTPATIGSALQHEWKLRALRSLHTFTRRGWKYAGLPGSFVDGWHIRRLCAELTRITRTGYGRLLWASPMRSTKSSILGTFWPAWVWAQEEDFSRLAGPWAQFLCVSHREDLSIRDNQRCRRLVKSDWYQELTEGRVQVRPDADQAAYFALTEGGQRRAFGIRSGITGHDSDIQIIDDPYDVEAVLSQVNREHVEFMFDEELPSRFNHPTRNAQIVAAQRTHTNDLHNHIIKSDDWPNWRYICIPGVMPAGTPDDPHPHPIEGDNRKPGEVYWPERYTVKSLNALAKTTHARAAQIQQNPRKRGAGVFKNAQIQFAEEYPRGLPLGRYWDKAATEEGDARDPDFTAGVLGGFDSQRRFWIVDIVHGRWSSANVERRIKLVANEVDGTEIPIWIEEEPGSSGKDVSANYQRMLVGHAVYPDRPTGQKLIRIEPFLAACEAGNVFVFTRRYVGPKVPHEDISPGWVAGFIDELDEFTGDDSTHDDRVMAAAQLYNRQAARLTQLLW